MMALILSGCGLRPKMVVNKKIPPNLADDALMPVVYGHYGKPLPNNIDELKKESIARGKDYIICRTSLDNNNVEMEAIRRLNR